MKELAIAAMIGFFCLALVIVCDIAERHDLQHQIKSLKEKQHITAPTPTSPAQRVRETR